MTRPRHPLVGPVPTAPELGSSNLRSYKQA